MSFVPYQRGGMQGIVPYVRGGFRGLGLTPGYTPVQQAMADAFKSQFGAPAAAYVAPPTVATPACAFGPTADTSECQALVQTAQQTRMQFANDANYTVDLANCLGTFPQPTNCYSRTFGLTPTGGYTSDAQAQGPQLILDAGGNVVGAPPPVFAPTPNPYVAAPTPAITGGPSGIKTLAPPASTTPPVTGGGGYVSAATDFLSSPVALGGSSFPIWELAGAGLLALFLLKGGH